MLAGEQQLVKALGLVTPDMHWLARDLGCADGSHCVNSGQELEYAVGAQVGSLWAALPPPAPRFDGAIW